MASTYLQKNTATATDAQKFTYSGWLKRGAGIDNAGYGDRFYIGYLDGNNRFYITFAGGDTIFMYAKTGGTEQLNWETNRKFRDPSAWYHIVVSADSTQGTQDDRLKLYVNGVQETSFIKGTSPGQNFSWGNQLAQSNNTLRISGDEGGNNLYDGSMANVEFVDGQQLTPAYFGSTDSTTGIWTPQASSTISSYGTNGFKLKMDTATPGADTSGNTNTFTVGGGTPTLTQGSPSNVYATFNPLDVNLGTVTTFSNGNTTVMHNAGSSGSTTAARSTLAYSAGKFYWETKCIASGGDVRTGIISMSSTDYNTQTNPFTLNECYNYKSNGDKGSWGDANSAYGATYTAGDIIGIAHDVSAGTLIFYKNGVSQGTAFTGLSTSLFWGAFSSEYNQGKYSYNFGEGFFGTTAAGTQADDNGQGLFAYDVPAGYYALNTKNLEAYS